MKITVLTMFPSMLNGLFESPIIQRAVKENIVSIEITDIKDFATGSFRHIDDSPYGGSKGMIMRMEPLVKSLENVMTENSHSVLFSPKGKVFNQETAKRFSQEKHLVLVCGHYEGVDYRFENYVDEMISMGDYIVSGGEYAASAVIDSVVRLLKGTLKEGVTANESHENNLLEEPQYTHPFEFRGETVPQILLSGNAKAISEWKHHKAIEETKLHRPDMAYSYMKKQILSAEESLRLLASERVEFLPGVFKYSDSKLPDMHDHNLYKSENPLTTEDIKQLFKNSALDGFVKLMLHSRLNPQIIKDFCFEETVSHTLAFYDTSTASFPKANKEVTIKTLTNGALGKDFIDFELSQYGSEYGEDFTLRKMHRNLTLSQHCKKRDYVGAYINSKLVGYLTIWTDYDCVGIDDLIVDEKSRHKGIASALLEYACKLAPFAYLHADANDTPIEMYKSMGFKIEFTQYEYFTKNKCNENP